MSNKIKLIFNGASFDQLKRLKKLQTDKFYLIDTHFNDIDNDITLHISGSTGNVYTININDNIFTCNCPDKHSCDLKKILCKHQCFLIYRVCKMYDNQEILDTRVFTIDDLHNIKNILKKVGKDTTLVNEEYSKRYNEMSNINNPSNKNDMFNYENCRNLEEDCSICFNSLCDDPEDLNSILEKVGCPICLNAIHKECIEAWLIRNNTCVFCRSDVWSQYKERKSNKNNSSYVNLVK